MEQNTGQRVLLGMSGQNFLRIPRLSSGWPALPQIPGQFPHRQSEQSRAGRAAKPLQDGNDDEGEIFKQIGNRTNFSRRVILPTREHTGGGVADRTLAARFLVHDAMTRVPQTV